MAIRIVGVDLPQNKRGEIALTYIYGIGRSRAQQILEKTGVDKDIKVKDWTDEQAGSIREYIGESFKVEGDLRSSSIEHQTSHGYRLLSWHPSPYRASVERSKHQEQRSYTQRQEKDRCQQEEGYQIIGCS